MLGLKKIAPALGLLVLLSACGGGGGDSSGGNVSTSQTTTSTADRADSSSDSSAVVSSASFKVNDAWMNLFASSVGGSSSFSSANGVIVKLETKEQIMFEGKSARRAELSVTWMTKEMSVPEDKVERFSFYSGVEPFSFLGSLDPSDGTYEVATSASTLPDSVKIGTTGPFATSLIYRDADKKDLIAEGRVDYSVEQDPRSDSNAWVCLIFTESDPSSHIRQSVTRLCSLVEDTGWVGKGFKLESEELDSNGNSIGVVRLF